MLADWGLRQWLGVAVQVALFLAAVWFLMKLAGPLFGDGGDGDGDPETGDAGKSKKP